ncbi:MAG: ArsR family transcriptional regulator [Candidatus Altiarchaeales archaeon ex4484_43]|nr:MAG: ArsR family transcriptional regulator [Candidatus Altiarchaeales archaeon ex4484_43]
MQITKFINREEELTNLEKLWDRNRAEFVVVYGRRRIGKTELIKQFIKDKPAIYSLARLESEKDQLDGISATISEFFNDPVIKKSPLTSWDAVFEYLYQKKKRFVMVFDEFPNMVHSPTILSIIQEYWDEKLKNSGIFIILCGSSLSMMEKYVLNYRTPIYGRGTYDLKIQDLRIRDVGEFFPDLGLDDVIKIYGVLGGTPAYLLEFSASLEDTIRDIMRGRSFLYREPEFVLREEVNEPRYFMSILHAISIGRNRVNEIVNLTGLDRGMVGKYLSILRDLDLVEREVSITEGWKTRRSLYSIRDNFFNFWFRFIYSNMQEIERNPEFALSEVKKGFNTYLGFVFEGVGKEFLVEGRDRLPLQFNRIGRWWHKDKEIDLVALGSNEIGFFEVKWSDLKPKESRNLLEKLKEKAEFVDYERDKEHYGIIARSIKGKEKLRNEGFLCYDLGDF